MDERSLKTLEYNKILNMVAEYASSDMGKNLIMGITPGNKLLVINNRLAKLKAAMALISENGMIDFGGLTDTRSYTKRASIGGVLHISALYDIKMLLRICEAARSYVKNISVDNVVTEMIGLINLDLFLLKDLDKAIVDGENISEDATPTLRSLYRKKLQKNEEINERLKSFVASKQNEKYLQESIVTIRDGRYVVPVKREYKGSVSGIVHDVSSSGGTYFIEPEKVVSLNNEIREIEIKIQEEIQRILKDFSERIGRQAEPLDYNLALLSELDVIFAKAKFAIDNEFTEPKFSDDFTFDLKQIFHPLIPRDKVVRTDIFMGSNLSSLIITGPNTGGKTVVLKTVGLIILLAQSGFYIPAAADSLLPLFDNVFTDIGDEQSIEQNLSTFSSHMVNLVNLLSKSHSRALYLFDELGAGTDPTEGAALAMSIIDSLRDKDIKLIATTHYAELKLYALKTDRVINGSMQFDIDTLKPTYRLSIGLPGRSNAFEISRKLGLGDEYIEKARSYVNDKSLDFERVLSEIEINRRNAESENERVKELLRLSEEKNSAAEERIRRAEEKAEIQIEKARAEAKNIYEKAKREYDEIIRNANRIINDICKDSAREIQETRDKLRHRISKLDKKSDRKSQGSLTSDDIILGMNVRIISLGNIGQVIELPDASGELKVQVGIMKLNAKLNDLEVAETSEKNDKKRGGYRNDKAKYANIEIDLRGVDTEELHDRIDKYLDDSVMAGLKEVTILHGKGTGALRKAAHEMLKKHPHVESYRLGKIGEGDTGVTVVTLK